MGMTEREVVLVTGETGFLGSHLLSHLKSAGFDCRGLGVDLLDTRSVEERVDAIQPKFVVHLAGISFAGRDDNEVINRVNVLGTLVLLRALSKLRARPKQVLVMSSGAVYGDAGGSLTSEKVTPRPASKYASSKHLMEGVAREFFSELDIGILRLFNFTGPGQNEKFLIPKIVSAFRDKEAKISLGNVDIFREFNDVRDFSAIIERLMKCEISSRIINVCSGRPIGITEVMAIMSELSGQHPVIEQEAALMRAGEIRTLSGDPSLLFDITGYDFVYDIRETLSSMYQAR